MTKPLVYRSGRCRNNERTISHTYMKTDEGLFPMCGYGWNRADGTAFSIWRGAYGTEGDCKICQKRLAAGLPPITDGWPHKTKWI